MAMATAPKRRWRARQRLQGRAFSGRPILCWSEVCDKTMSMKKRIFVTVTLAAALAALPAMAEESASATLYKSKCAMCHAADGSGSTPTGKAMHVRDLRSDEVQKQTDVELTKVIAGGKGKMP